MPKIAPIPSSKLRKVFEKAGFKCVRVEGDHYVYTKPGIPRPIVIPDWPEVPVFIIKNNLRTANISREEYFELLEKV
ncbi:MAG: type II toxin-antitoxin system HicA family toxin [Nitrospirae bacterium]|nr:type II toxin-antitoxin system HicA family toxin [Nitrospirota bacterium]